MVVKICFKKNQEVFKTRFYSKLSAFVKSAEICVSENGAYDK